MKKFLSIILSILCLNIFGQYTHIPDDNFEQTLINMGYDDVLNDYVLTANINNIDTLYIPSKNISDLTGIEDFISLTHLECQGNNLTDLDFSHNTMLEYIDCQYNNLANINISNNINLSYLNFSQNHITNIYLSNNTNLQRLICYNNSLNNLDISNNTNLTYIDFTQNNLTNINISNNILLEEIQAGTNILDSLDVSNNLNLMILWVSNNNLTGIDIRSNMNLQSLNIANNHLSFLVTSENTSLNALDCRNNQITELDLKNNPLNVLYCQNNNLDLLDIRNNYNNNMLDMYATNNPNLRCIYVDDTNLLNPSFWHTDYYSTFVTNENECNDLEIKNDYSLEITIYPNPIKDNLYFENNSNEIFMNANIYDISGKLISSKIIEKNKINVSNLPNGFYILKLSNDKTSVTKKFIVKY